MTKKFVTVEIPLVELSSDSDRSVQQPPASPAASRSASTAHTPRRFPTVSDDDDDPETPPGYGQPLHGSPRPPVHRFPTPPPPQPVQMPAPAPLSRPPLAPRGARMSVGRFPARPMAIRDFPPGFPPQSTYELGESSRQPDYRLQQARHMDTISAQLRETQRAFFELQGTQTRIMDRLGEFEHNVGRLRKDVDYRTEEWSVDAQRTREELAEQTSTVELLTVVAGVVVVVAVLVGLLPYFFRS